MSDLIRKADVQAIEEKLADEAMGDKPAIEFAVSQTFLLGYMKGLFTLLLRVLQLPTIDAVEVVRCKECKYGGKRNDADIECKKYKLILRLNDFCSYGERRER